MRRKLFMVAVVAVMLVALAGCGSSGSKLAGSYANGSMKEYEYGGTVMGMTYDTYSINIYDDNTYAMTFTNLVDMGGVAAGTTTITSYGSYKKGASADGFVELTIDVPTRMIYNSYSTLGGFAFDYDTDKDTEYIIPGGDDQAITKDEFMNQLGYSSAKTFYIALDSTNAETCHLELSK